jgi:hypothetical protein
MAYSLAWKRYNWRILWLSVLYALFLIGAVYGFKHRLFEGGAAYVAAILPALPIIGIFAAMGRYLIEEQDEYVRMLMVRQALWASGCALSLATIWAFLDSFDLVDHSDSYLISLVWFFGLGLAGLANRFTDREARS